MFRFENPIYLWLLLIVPVLALLRFWGWRQRKRKLRKFGDPELLKELMPDVSKYRPSLKFWLMQAALALLIIMLARPQMGTKISREKRNGIETIICLDISNSMKCEDVVPSRLQKSKMLIENLVDHFTNDKIGLIVFAGDAFVQLPITSDYVSAKMFLQNIEPSLIDMQGTDIARALSLAMSSFTQQEKIGRAIIVITDGEDHEGGVLETAEAARKKGINVFILGVGDGKGSPIPDGQGGYMRDQSGEVVMTALNEQMCQQIAQAGSGKYIHVDNTSDAQEKLNEELAKLQKGETDSVIYSEYDEQFQAFGILVLLLLIVEVCILESKNPVLRRFSLFGKGKNKKALVAVLLLCCSATMSAQTDRQHIRAGNKLFRQQQYDKAEVEYQKALTANERNPQAMYNLGCALMMQQKDSAAIVQFEHAGKLETSKMRKAQVYHNIGWICQKSQLYSEAVEAYKESLRNNPNDNETRYNLALCMRQKKNQQNQGNGGDNDKNKDKDKKEQQNQQNQDNKSQDKQQQKPNPNEQMSKDNAEQLLNAAMQEEKATQQRMKKAMQHPNRRQLKKNW
ncbi:MAG: VWA domain-containing protein [Prevotella sp.]|nr:VWA domain-containing protein [Prevotella sp.]